MFLELHRYSEAYRGRLGRAGQAFIGWLSRNRERVTLAALAHDPALANQMLLEFIDSCYVACVGFWIPKHAILAVQNSFPRLRGQLARAWDALWSWKMRAGPRSRTPLLHDVLIAIFMCCLDAALSHPRRALYYFSAAALFRTGFIALLRPGELLNLRFGDIQFHTQNLKTVAILAIPYPRSRRAFGQAQFAVVRERGLVRWLRWLSRQAPPSFKIWRGGRHSLAQLLVDIQSSLDRSAPVHPRLSAPRGRYIRI